MDLRNAIHSKTGDHSKLSHIDAVERILLYDTELASLKAIAWIFLLYDRVKKSLIDLIDDFQMTW